MEEPHAATSPSRLNLWEMLVGTFISPSDTLPQIAQQRPMGAALGFLIGLEIVGYVLSVAFPSKEVLRLGIQKEFSIITMILDMARHLIAFIVFVALVHGIINIFKDAGSYRGTFCALAFARAPIIVFDLLNIIASFSYQPLGPWPSTLENFSSTEIFTILLVIFIIVWMVTLGIIAIRAHYDIRPMGAVLVYILAAVADGLIFFGIRQLFRIL